MCDVFLELSKIVSQRMFRFVAGMVAAAVGDLRDHRIQGRAVLPGSAMLEIAGLGMRMLLEDGLDFSDALRDTAIISPYLLPSTEFSRCLAFRSTPSTSLI